MILKGNTVIDDHCIFLIFIMYCQTLQNIKAHNLVNISEQLQCVYSGGHTAVLSVRFEVGVSCLLAPAGADERGPKAPFPPVENAGIQLTNSQESTCQNCSGRRGLLKDCTVQHFGTKYRITRFKLE